MGRSKRKNIVLAVAIVLAIVLLVGNVVQAVLYWAIRNAAGEGPEVSVPCGSPVRDGEGQELSGGVNAMPLSMSFASAVSLYAGSPYNDVTIQATVSPESAQSDGVVWSVAFINASSAWATGKVVTDYVTVTPERALSSTATVRCLQPFGEQIAVIAALAENPLIHAECTVDFRQRVTGLKADFIAINFDGDEAPVQIGNRSYQIFNGVEKIRPESFRATYSDYTVADSFSFEVTISGSEELYEKILQADYATLGTTPEGWASDWSAQFDLQTFQEYILKRSEDVSGIKQSGEVTLYIALKDACQGVGGQPYGGAYYQSEIPQPAWDPASVNLIHAIARQNIDTPYCYLNLKARGEYSDFEYSVACYGTPIQFPVVDQAWLQA